MSVFQILLLGAPELRWQGNIWPIQRRTTRSLLFYLAAMGGMVSRGELLINFWEDQSPEQARSRLRETLSRLRRELPLPDLILTPNDLVGLNFERADVDQHRFDSLLNAFGQLPWKIPAKDPLPADVLHNLLAAARLWRGPRYLAGADLPCCYELDHWLTVTTQHYEQLYRQVFERLSCHYEAQGDWEQAVQYAERVIANDRLNEDLHARILNLFINAGKIDIARQYYAQVRTLFLQEFGAPPGEQFDKILARLQLTQPIRKPFELPKGLQPRQIIESPFVGQTALLAQLWQAYQTKTSVFLSGEIGIGKTRLIQEFLQRHQPPGILICTRCLPGEQNNPFQSSMDAEREYGYMRQILERIPPIYARQLVLLLPDMAAEYASLLGEPPATLVSDQLLTLEAWRQFTLTITEAQPGLFIIEDIQWMDMATLTTMDYVIKRQPFGSRAMLILSGRADECPPAMLKTIHSWMAAGHLLHIEINRLTLADIYSLSSAVLPAIPSPEFVAQLAADSGGNPYFTLEILRQALHENPGLDVSRAFQLPLPASIAIVIRSQIEGLTPLARQILTAAAVVGVEFVPDVVQFVVKADLPTFQRALDELEARGLVAILPLDSEVCYRFTQEKVRQILLDELKPRQRRALHQKTAESLVALYGAHIPRAALAYHCQQAGDLVKAYENWLQAALGAQQQRRFVEAQQAFEQAEALLELAGLLISVEAIYRLYYPWQRQALALNDSALLQQISQNCLTRGQQRGSPLLIGAALNAQTRLAVQNYQLAEGLNTVTQAMPYLEQADQPAEYMEAHTLRGILYYLGGHFAPAGEQFQRALAIGEMEETPSPALIGVRAYTHEHLALLQHARGWMKDSRQHAQAALADAILAEDYYHQSMAYFALAQAHLYLGEYAQARLDTDFGLGLASQIGADRLVGYHHLSRAAAELKLGHLAASASHVAQSLQLAQQYRLPGLQCLAYQQMGDLYLALSQGGQALKYFQLGQALSQGSFLESSLWARLAQAWVHLGDLTQAHEAVERGISLARKMGADLYRLEAELTWAWLLLRRGEYAQAHHLLLDLQLETERRQLVHLSIAVALALGEIARQQNHLEQAAMQLEAVASQATLINAPWLEFRARILLRQVLQAQYKNPEAQHQRIQFLFERIAGGIAETDRLPEGEWLHEVFRAYCRQVYTTSL